MTTGASLIHVDGRWIRLDPAAARLLLTSLRRHQQEHVEVDAATLLRLAADAGADVVARGTPTGGDGPGAGVDLAGDGWAAELLAGLPDDRLAEEVEPPGFEATLRPYQRRGLGWLQFLAELGLGDVSPTTWVWARPPTTLAHLVARPGPHLVVCPLSVVRQLAGGSRPVHPAAARARAPRQRPPARPCPRAGRRRSTTW